VKYVKTQKEKYCMFSLHVKVDLKKQRIKSRLSEPRKRVGLRWWEDGSQIQG
jgi:hypothetical protein